MTKNAAVHLLTEFAPVFAFFLAGQCYDFFTATTILMVVTIISLGIGWLHAERIALLPIISAVFVLLAGAITVLYKAPDALIFSDTLYYFILALVIGIGIKYDWLILERIFRSSFAITREGWCILSIRWVAILVTAGVANEIVRLTLPPEFWVDYKFAKVIVITIIACWQCRLAGRYRIEGESNGWGLRTSDPKK